jgi:hypothetical protein
MTESDGRAVWTAAKAFNMPNPESRSNPAASISIAVFASAFRVWAVVRLELLCSSKTAIAAACGAAADVPKNGLKPGVAVLTPSAAVTSGFCRIAPPLEEKFPAVIGVPSAWKKIRRGPSELKVSTVQSEVNGLPPAPAQLAFTAATVMVDDVL